MGPTSVAGRDPTRRNIIRRPNVAREDPIERSLSLLSWKVPGCQLRELGVVIGADGV